LVKASGIGFLVQTVFCPTLFSHLDHAHVIAVEATGAYEPDDILAREPDGCQYIPEPVPLQMARFITAIIMSVFFAVYSSIRPCKASPLLRYLKNHLASFSSDIPNFPSLPFSPSSAKSRIIWIIPSVTVRNILVIDY
jgi:hypothetical protein